MSYTNETQHSRRCDRGRAMNIRKICMLLLTGTFLLFLDSTTAKSQISTGSISGQIRDSSGAAIPGATVSATNRGTGLVRSAETSADGRFKLAAMPSGIYDVKAEAPAFKSEVQQNLTVTVAQESVLN